MNLQVKVGTRYLRHGSEYEVSHIDRTRVIVKSVIEGKVKSFCHGDFDYFINSNHIELNDAPSQIKYIDDKYLEKKDIEIRNYRLEVVESLLASTLTFSSRKGKKYKDNINLINKISDKHNQKHRSISTVAKWVKRFVESNYSPNSLLPQHNIRRTKFSDETEILIEAKIEENLTSKHRIVKKVLTEEVLMDLEKSFDSIVLPSRRTIQRRIDSSDPTKIFENLHGPRKSRKFLSAAGRSKWSTRALEYVEADGNYLDVLTVDTFTGEITGRVYLTVLIDVHTRCILSFHLTHTPFSGHSFLEAFKAALNEENGLPGGKIQRLIVDNGADYISESAKNICNLTRTEIEVAPPGSPNSKPHVERFFRTLNQQLIHQAPGTTFSNPQHRGEYQSEKFACLDLETLRGAIFKFISIYHKSSHLGLNGIPIDRWHKAKRRNRLFSYDSQTIENFAKLSVMRFINKGRVNFEGLRWYSHALRTLELKMEQRSAKQKVQIFINESDLSTVLVKDPFSDNLIQADNIKPQYAMGLSLFEHRQISQNQKQENANAMILSDEESLRLRIQLRDELWAKSDKNSRKLKARLSDGNSDKLHKEKTFMEEQVYSSEEELAEQYFDQSFDDSLEVSQEIQVSFISSKTPSDISDPWEEG